MDATGLTADATAWDLVEAPIPAITEAETEILLLPPEAVLIFDPFFKMIAD
jgi:hypothetical protein